MSKVLKAMYFKETEFYASSLGGNPSPIWRSIWFGSEIVRKGCRMTVGNGESIRVWHIPWLPCKENCFVTSAIPPGRENLTVSVLFSGRSRNWNSQLVDSLFDERDRRLIYSIPLSVTPSADSWSWIGDQSGQYSVKSGYRAIHDANEQCHAKEDSCWKLIWKAKAIPKMINTVWRAASNNLPNRSRLRQRRVIDNAICPVCNREEESIVHCLVSCSFAQEVWRRSQVGWIFGNSTCFCQWPELVHSQVSLDSWNEVIALCWGIWKHRNEVLWRNKRAFPNVVVSRSVAKLKAWMFHNRLCRDEEHADSRVLSAACKWKKPNPGCIKVNVDAGVFQEAGAISSVRRNHEGRFIGAVVRHFPYLKDPTVLEVLAIREILTWLKDRELQGVEIESDCLEVVKDIHSSVFIDSQYGLLISDCRDVLATLHSVRVVYIRRSANLAANSLVRAVGSSPGLRVWGYSPPNYIQAVLTADLII